MNPDPATPDYEVEIVEDEPARTVEDNETGNIEQEGDPIGDNFA